MRVGAVVVASCLALAAASLLIPSAPTTDPWGWIVWGREITHLELSTASGGAPSWKPLPVLFTAPLSLLGGAAPDLWLVVARTAGLLGLVAAFQLSSRLAGRAAGAVAVMGLLLSSHWARRYLHGYAEPLAIALLLMAVERHWLGRPRQALLLAVGVALVRPEAFPLVLVYALRLWRRRQLRATGFVAVALSVPALWLVPDWIGSGDPFHGGRVARAVAPHGLHAALAALGDVALITPTPLSLAAIAAFAVAYRIGDRRVTELSTLAAAWSALLIVLLLAGYPVVARFYVLPAALVCVLGAAGAVRAVRSTLARTSRRPVIAASAIGTVPLVAARAEMTASEARNAVQRAQLEGSLGESIAQAGGPRLRTCGTPVLPRGLGWLRGEVGLAARAVAEPGPLGGNDRGGVPGRAQCTRYRDRSRRGRGAHQAPPAGLPRALWAYPSAPGDARSRPHDGDARGQVAAARIRLGDVRAPAPSRYESCLTSATKPGRPRPAGR